MVAELFLSSFCISLNLGNLSVYQKKKDRDLTYNNYLKLQKELDKSYDMFDAFVKLGLKDECNILWNNFRILINKIDETHHEYYNLKAAHITAVKEQIKIMVLLLGVMPQLKTRELREKEKLMKASAIKIVLMKEKNKLNFQEIERLNKIINNKIINNKIINNSFFILPFRCGNEGQAAEYKRKEYDDAYGVLQEKINEAEDAYAVAEEEIYQLLVKIFIY